jgi:hypothetical protein
MKEKNMPNLIEKNKDWLNFYRIAAKIIGWIFIIFNALPFLMIPYMIYFTLRIQVYRATILAKFFGVTTECLLGRLPLGIVLLGIAQLIKYIIEPDYQPRWLLRHGSFLLYLFAALTLISLITRYWYNIYFTDTYENIPTVFLSYLPLVFVKVLLLMGLGAFLKRIMPVIEEAKSLV